MAESKRTFQSAKMDKDIDDRLLPPGTYRDALNVSVEFSEDGNVGALENLKGNIELSGQTADWLDSSVNIGLKVIAAKPHPEENKIYYFIAGSKTDAVVEYDFDTNTVNPIVLDSTEPIDIIEDIEFTFADAIASATVSVDGRILVKALVGTITAITENFNETVTNDTERIINAKVRVPSGYSNARNFVEGTITVTQPAVGAPDVRISRYNSKTDTSIKLNGAFNANSGLTALGFKYIENTGGSTAYTNFSNKFLILENDLYNNVAVLTDSSDHHFSNVPLANISVIDKNGASISELNNWEYTTFSNGQPSTFKILNESLKSLLPITIGAITSANNITTGASISELQSNGTTANASVIGSPFSSTITGLSPDTEYIFQAFATNVNSTTYSAYGLFRTNVASISLPTFSSSSASVGTETVTFTATPNSDGGDSGTALYVVSSETSSSLATYKANAKTILGGGTVSGYSVSTIGTWSTGVAQSVTVSTTGGSTRYGLVFAKNSSPTDGGDGAGYTFDTGFVSATANVANVNGAATFSGTIVGPTGTKTAGQTLTWSVNGTSTVTVVPVGGHTLMHSDVARTGGTGDTWHPGGGWIIGGNTNTVGGTQSWNYSETTTAPTTPGTYSWRITLYYDSNTQSGGVLTGSFTIPAPLPTSGTFTLDQNLIIGPYVGQAYGGGTGTGLVVTGPLPSNINVGTLVTLTFGGSTNVIQVTAKNSGSTNSFIGYNLYSGSGGVAASSGNTINWSV